MNIAQLHQAFLSSTGICTDTRKLTKGQLYFALKGANFNGNSFAQEALDQGAQLAIIDEAPFQNEHTILVDDVLTTLQQLATFHRKYLGTPIVSLTGSNGKTTTKELIKAVLSQKFTTTATQGNLNNLIGVPLTLLSMDATTEIGIVEMGANHQKEIATLAEIACPDFGYITNFGKAHLEGFGGIQGVIKGKSELYDYLRVSEGTAFVNADDALQVKQSTGISCFTFGKENSVVPVEILPAAPFAGIQIQDTIIKSQLTGEYNATNIAAAAAIGCYFKIPLDSIKSAIEAYTPANNRSQIIQKEGYTIILDAYNANPTSMEAALRNLSAQNDWKTVAFLGDMFEVGPTSAEEHQGILELAHRLNVDKVFAVGPDFGKCKPLTNQVVFETYDAFAKAYKRTTLQGAILLIKGSRGMRMERVLDLLNS